MNNTELMLLIAKQKLLDIERVLERTFKLTSQTNEDFLEKKLMEIKKIIGKDSKDAK